MDQGLNQMVEAFAHGQLMQTIHAGQMIGLSPVSVAASMMQISASLLVAVSPQLAAAVLRAYAAVIDAGPADTPLRAAAIDQFMQAGATLIAAAKAARDFPQPQGRA